MGFSSRGDWPKKKGAVCFRFWKELCADNESRVDSLHR